MIDLYPRFKHGSCGVVDPFLRAFKKTIGKDVMLFSCARAAMVFFLRAQGFSRLDEILVPPFLGSCVLSALIHTIFPSLQPSNRTKVIMVYHQFGFPQKIEEIAKTAKKNKWRIISNASNTLFSKSGGIPVIEWGDAAIVSFAKLFPTGLGGALLTEEESVWEQYAVNKDREESRKEWSNKALSVIQAAHQMQELTPDMHLEVEGVYGYLPELVSFPQEASGVLPQDEGSLACDRDRRKELLELVGDYFPDRIPEYNDCEVVPFAIPIQGDREALERVAQEISEALQYKTPVLHFDFARNMLTPRYEPALIIGCHEEWTTTAVHHICDIIKKRI